MAATAATLARARDDLVRVVHRSSGLPAFARDMGRTLQRVVPFEGVCLLTVDPATLLPTGEFVQNGLPPSARVRLTEIELGEPDVNKFAALVSAPVPAASLSAATRGELDRSLRQREIRRPNGFADELRAVLSGPTGSWGTLTLLREARRPHFSTAEVGLVAALAATLADGVRRAMLVDGGVGDGPSDTGFVVLAADDTVELANPAAERWLEELSPPGPPAPGLPVGTGPWSPRPVGSQPATGTSRRASGSGPGPGAGWWSAARSPARTRWSSYWRRPGRPSWPR